MNIEEIAKLSGFSRSTVSRVLNDDPNVKDSTRRKVSEIIRRMNYQPNMAARGLAAGRTRVLGLVIPMGVAALFTNPFFSILIQGISSACNSHNHSVMLWLAEPEYERRMIGQILHNGLIDGVIVASQLTDDPVGRALLAGDLPFLFVGRHPTNQNVNFVDTDNFNGAREAVLHLIRLGRRRVAAISGPSNMIAGLDRKEGYLAARRERGLAPDPDLIEEGDFTEAGGYQAMQRLLAQRPDAVFASSDALAVGALRALHEAGLRVPQDVALVGYDDMPFAAQADPPLTTVRQPVLRLGMAAAQTLMEVVEQPDAPPRRVVLPTELIVRASCGAYPAGNPAGAA